MKTFKEFVSEALTLHDKKVKQYFSGIPTSEDLHKLSDHEDYDIRAEVAKHEKYFS